VKNKSAINLNQMKSKLKFIVMAFALLAFPKINFGQAPPLGTAAKWALFSTTGAITNTGTGFLTKVTGNVGSVAGAVTGFGNVDGVMTFAGHADNAACAADILLTYSFLDLAPTTNAPGILLGNGQILNAGVHTLPSASTMNGELILDAQGDPNAIFIFRIQGPFATNTNSRIKLVNGALACNVYWKVEGAVSMATGATMRGTIIANNAAITMNVGDTLEGRALAINGAILTSEILAYTPIGCGSAVNVGPVAPTFGASACYAILSSNGALANTPVSNITGDVGNAIGALGGWTGAEVTGALHPTGDGATMAAATDLGNVNSYLLALPFDIELLFPPLFGHNLVLTPHTYLLNSATTLTDTVYLNAQGDPDAVFVFQMFGAFDATANSRVVLMNGAQAKNVYWKINGAVDIGVNSIFNGTMIVDGAFLLQPGVVINGRALTINGAITTTAVTVSIPSSISVVAQPLNDTACVGNSASFSINITELGLSYQWRKGIVNLVDGGNISGAQTATLTINPVSLLDAANDYNVVVSGGSCGSNFTSDDAALIITSSPSITVEPISQTSGCSGGIVSFSVAATGSSLTYQWRNGTVNLNNGGNISGAQTATLTINPASISDTSSFYNVVITGGAGGCTPNDTSLFVSLMLGNPIIITEPLNQTACAGASVQFEVTSTGTALVYQWRNGTTNLIDGGNISGAQTATLTINPASISDTSSFYNVVISGGCTPNDTSINVSLQLNGPIIISEPLSQTICSGNSVNFSVTATGSALTYQWKNGTVDLIDGGNISGAQTATLTINAAAITDTSSFYNVVIIGACSPNDTSINVSLVVEIAPSITLEPVSQLSCIGSSVVFSISATGTNLAYQWMNGNSPLVNSGTVSGAQTATLTISPISISDTSSNYYVVVSGNCPPNDTSLIVSLTTSSPIITTEPVSQSVCSGSLVSFSVVASGSSLTYQWRKGTVNLIDGGNISGAQTPTLTINAATITDTSSFYNVVIVGACSPNDTSINVTLNVGGSIITTEPVNQSVCLGSSASFAVSATGTGVLTYQWRKVNATIIDGGNISGAQTATLTINPTVISDTSSFYYVVVTGGCAPNDTSVFVSLDVNLIPSVVASSNSPVCSGNPINLTTPAVSLATYNWTGPNGFTSSAQNPVILVSTLTDAGTYTLIVTASGCSSLPSSAIVTVNVCSDVDLSVVKTVNDTIPFIGKTVVFTITATNNSSISATGVEVTDVLQSGYVYVSSSATLGSYNPTTGIWTIGNLSNGSSETLTITATVIADGNYVNNALVQGNEVDPNFSNNFSSVETFPTDFNIPEGFSPNGDGINDLFVIRGIKNFPKNEFTIFNRWGNKVFEASPYKNTWNGKTDMGIRVGGDELPVGTYFYILDLQDGTPVYKGTIYLNK